HQRTLEFLLPREKQQVQESAIRAELNLAKTEATLPTTLQMKRIELEKLQHSHQQLEEKLALHLSDRELMTVKAPAAGVVYYGEATRGKWSTAATLRQQLRPGGTVSATTVLMTIVPGGPSFVRVDVPEDKYRYFQQGTPARIKPTAFPKTVLTGQCGAASVVLVKDGTFDGRVAYDANGSGPSPLVGMTCKVILTPVDKDDAIAVPSEGVFEDETESGKHYVYLEGEDPPQRQPVEAGEKHKARTEILSGLKEGDVILLEKP
ncbi:MAG: efflux RND transporter periplasmic adaptor subunit, partial [Planctomycetaceae bacterium]